MERDRAQRKETSKFRSEGREETQRELVWEQDGGTLEAEGVTSAGG